MDTSLKSKPFIKPKTMAELLPGLSSILNEDAVRSLTAKKQPRATIAQTRTAEKVVKPLTIAEMRADIVSLLHSPKRTVQPNTSTKKRNWNSSVKPENKTKSLLSNGQTKRSSVRKVLNFQPKNKPVTNVRTTLISSETPKFPKPELRAKKSLNIQAKNSVRISGVYRIPQAKQNFPVTPSSNLSFKSNSDASFLQNEKHINDQVEKARAIIERPILDNIAEATPPISTPFKEYRNVQEYFNDTCDLDNSLNNNTIMNFDKELSKENSKREESVIVSLCDMLNKAAVTSIDNKTDLTVTDKINTELNELLEIEKETENNIRAIEMGIKTLNDIKEAQQKSLQNVRKLINAKKNIKPVNESDSNSADTEMERSTKQQPSYKIPKKNTCLRKKVFRKSLPNVSDGMQTPPKNKVLDMYMEMKEKMNFLNTPSVKRQMPSQDTPTITSHNLQKQLDKLYNGS
ncbi:uncharacterized protein LOC116767754 [Danaus plexippus]|uniref:uncharacterized protein LOC116767754 n=1 Tax=Danaus plexippus TaxID=13037 RepID=UPI002AB1AD46|nr:uncharacterized protein LOC116767754 [Danaus plexippus]